MSYYFALSSGPGPSHGNSGPGPSQGNRGPGPSQGDRNEEEESSDRMSDQEYLATMKKFKNLLKKKIGRKDNARRPIYFKHDVNQADDSSSEDDCLEDSPFLREIESCQKMRVKILLELYKHIDDTPLEVWHTLKHEKSQEGDKTSQ